jgi:hypothetical protein
MNGMLIPKTPYLRSKKLRDSARGEACHMRHPKHCTWPASDVVWCHSNQGEHGKGYGIKASDEHGFYGCQGCHAFYDVSKATRTEKTYWYEKAHKASIETAKRKGVLK